MCGIVGIISTRSAEGLRKRCSTMVDAIRYRGPDGSGIYQMDGVALGHARLAIVDLSPEAAQPMLRGENKLSIVFNGEIYNHREIRKTLEALGQKFYTFSDTEVLLAAYETWGVQFVERLNGIFAIALFDIEKACLLLARDRVGVKPLYWRQEAGEILFASEAKAISAGSGRSMSINRTAVLEYLSFQNYLDESTLFEGVQLLPAATVLSIDTRTLEIRDKRYWSAMIAPAFASEAEARQKIDTALNAAVKRQMQADVEVNSFLSGGIDSCAIASLATNAAGRIKTFTCGFGIHGVTEAERQFDERAVAEGVAASLGSEHYETVLNADDFLARMHDWAWHAEEPRVGSSFPTFCVSGLASKFTKVCMSGTGGDELFGGYPWRYRAATDASNRDEFIQKYYGFWHRMVSPDVFSQLTTSLRSEIRYDSFAAFDARLRSIELRTSASAYPWADTALLFEMETFLQGLLIVEDKASMAHGLEVRVPLLDNEVIDAALATPFKYKVGVAESGFHGQYGKGTSNMPAYANGKKILRDVLSAYVPENVASARKQGFSPPFETWFRTGLRSWLDADVFGAKSLLADLVDMQVARRLWSEHVSGHANHRLFVWGMISLYLSINAFKLKAA